MAMTKSAPTPAAIQRIRTVSLLVLGALVPLLPGTVLELLTFRAPSGESSALHAWVVNGAMLIGEVMTMVVAYRVARYSKLPGTATILMLMSLVVGTVLASHFL